MRQHVVRIWTPEDGRAVDIAPAMLQIGDRVELCSKNWAVHLQMYLRKAGKRGVRTWIESTRSFTVFRVE
jgi:hypothetical protein